VSRLIAERAVLQNLILSINRPLEIASVAGRPMFMKKEKVIAGLYAILARLKDFIYQERRERLNTKEGNAYVAGMILTMDHLIFITIRLSKTFKLAGIIVENGKI
jgi:hypothetical protein